MDEQKMGGVKKWWVAGIVVIVLIIGAVLATNNPSNNEIIKIGAILPLTGDFASYGEGFKNTIALAIENSGLKDRVQLIIEDDGSCAPNQDINATQKLVSIDKVKAIIGPICSSAFLSVLPITEKNKVVLISYGATSKSISGAGKYAFRVISSDADKAIAIANTAYNASYKKAALLYDSSNDQFIQQKDDAKGEYIKLGGQIVADESFQTGNKDFRSQLTKIKNSGAEAIFLGVFPTTQGVLVLKQAKELGIKAQLISLTSETGAPDFIKLAGNLTENLIFPYNVTPTNKEYTDFINSYKTKFGKESVTYAAESYDTAMLIIKGMAKSNGTPDDIKNEIYKLGQNYYGASGIINFKLNGDVDKPAIIQQIINGQPIRYSK